MDSGHAASVAKTNRADATDSGSLMSSVIAGAIPARSALKPVRGHHKSGQPERLVDAVTEVAFLIRDWIGGGSGVPAWYSLTDRPAAAGLLRCSDPHTMGGSNPSRSTAGVSKKGKAS